MAIACQTPSDHRLDAPIETILDLWYARHGDRAVHFSYETLLDRDSDDWLMRNMATVVKRIFYTTYTHGRAHMALSAFDVHVMRDIASENVSVRLLERSNGNRGEQSATHPNT